MIDPTKNELIARGRALFPVIFPLSDGGVCNIRAATENDAEAFLSFFPAVIEETDFLNYMPGEFQLTVTQEQAFLKAHAERFGCISLIATIDGRVVGTAGAESQRYRRYAHSTEVGIAIAQEACGAGLGRKMMECLLQWGRVLGLRKMCLRVFADNDRARCMYKSLGFVQEGILRNDAMRADGGFRDSLVLAFHYQ